MGAAETTCETLSPSYSRQLPLPLFARARALAWSGDGQLLIATHNGVVAYDLTKNNYAALVSGQPIPNGIPDVVGLDSDGRTLFAFNADYSDLAAEARIGTIRDAHRRPALKISDVAMRSGKVAVIGYPVFLKGTDFCQLWIGEPGAPWETFLPLHPIAQSIEETVRYSLTPYGGAVTFLSDDTVAMISPAEAGIFRYKTDGTPLRPLARGLRELVVTRMVEATKGYAQDVDGRYREIFNKQPMIDDLVNTPDGLAIVVREWSPETRMVHWELWFPDTEGVRRRVPLSMTEQRIGGGDLQCATRGTKLACIYGHPAQPNGSITSELDVFDLAKIRCH